MVNVATQSYATLSLNVPANLLSWPEYATANLERGYADIPGPAKQGRVAYFERLTVRDNSARRCKHHSDDSVNAHRLPGRGAV